MEQADAESPSSHEEEQGNSKKRKRTRTGCLNCRRRRRKCDEARPTCSGCQQREEVCERGLRLKFRAENAIVLEDETELNTTTPSPKKRAKNFHIIDATSDIIKEYLQGSDHQALKSTTAPTSINNYQLETVVDKRVQTEGSHVASQDVPSPPLRDQLLDDSAIVCISPSLPRGRSLSQGNGAQVLTPSTLQGEGSLNDIMGTPVSQNRTVDAAANLLYLRQTITGARPALSASTSSIQSEHLSPTLSRADPLHVPDAPEDGIFLPGSTYQELHATLRNHLINESVLQAAERREISLDADDPLVPDLKYVAHNQSCYDLKEPVLSDLSHSPVELSKDEECLLWKNWIDEIAGWLDKFDKDQHFRTTLPIMAKSHRYLECSMLALSARQLEKMESNIPTDRSLALYQEAIHLLVPQIHLRSTAVIASCVVLCVLEMLSCSPKAWRRHLDGCAHLMEAVGINGFSGGVEQALFWCFARMDVCGGLISGVRTLIPVEHWASKVNLDADTAMFRSIQDYGMYANHAVYLCARILELVHGSTSRHARERSFDSRWLKLWRCIQDWEAQRPSEMYAIISFPASSDSPFPTVLFSNPAAISGNQLYHAASILMLRNRPQTMPSSKLGPKLRSILWHARQICGISSSNDHHGAWTNSIQPLWIAGQCMSHPSEHAAIFEILKKIETRSGWGTKWRMDDLREFWGDLD